jgi:hypothetical protein
MVDIHPFSASALKATVQLETLRYQTEYKSWRNKGSGCVGEVYLTTADDIIQLPPPLLLLLLQLLGAEIAQSI